MITFDIKAQLHKVVDTKTGTSKTGKEWKKVDFVLSKSTNYNGNEYDDFVAMSALNDTADAVLAIPVGHLVDIKGRINAREYQGRWYNDLTVMDITDCDQRTAPAAAPGAPAAPATPASGDLPF